MSAKNLASHIDTLCGLFRGLDPEKEMRISIAGIGEKKRSQSMTAKVTIAGFSEDNRQKNGKLDTLSNRTGSVFLYGASQPDYFIILNDGKKTLAFSLANAAVKREGIAGSILHIEAPDWAKAASLDINISNVFSGAEGYQFFTKTLLERVNTGEYAARLGKWISTKVFDRDLPREEADRLSIEEEMKAPNREVIRTMVIGSDIANIQLAHEKKGHDEFRTLLVRQTVNTTKVPFKDIVVEYDTLGREIGAGQSKSTYVFLTGAPFNAPANLLIIRHRPKG